METSSVYFSLLKKVSNSRETPFLMRLNAWNRPSDEYPIIIFILTPSGPVKSDFG